MKQNITKAKNGRPLEPTPGEKAILQLTSGNGPAECCRVVALVQELMIKQARQQSIHIEVIGSIQGEQNGTLQSSCLLIEGVGLHPFLKEWTGTILWIAQSPYRKMYKRKNWFIGIEVFDMDKAPQWDLKDVKLETLRASGPGGQHVNKVESAVRGTHLPSGIQVLAMDARSQLQNKKLCLARLESKVMAWQTKLLSGQQQSKWEQHKALERGNAVKVIRANL